MNDPKDTKHLCVGGPLDGTYLANPWLQNTMDTPEGHRYVLVGCTTTTTIECGGGVSMVKTAHRMVWCSEEMSPEEFQRYYTEVVLPTLEAVE